MMGKKILFIEDEADQVMLVQTRLEANGFDVDSAGDGEEGLKKANEVKPDLIILDLFIPKLSGYEVCKQLKADPETKDIPIIVMTASGERDLEEKCQAHGADEMFRKPYDSRELVEKIRTLIDK